MKTNKLLAVFMTAAMMVAFSACNSENNPENPNNEEETTLALDKTSINLEVEGTETLTATVEAAWESSAPEVATVEGNGKTVIVKGIKEGSAVITAKTVGGQVKTCVVLVKKKGGEQGGGAELKGSQIWPIILDGATYAANESKIVASFQPNDVDQFLYVWENTYSAGNTTGLNFHGNSEGYTALVVASGWSGCGFCLTEAGEGWKNAETLRAAMVANPDEYFLHLAIKSTDNYSHCFYFMGSEATKFGLGASVQYDAPAGTLQNFTRDGSWVEFDIPMATYASALAATTCVAGVNVFVALSEGVPGAQLNLDAVYFYKK